MTPFSRTWTSPNVRTVTYDGYPPSQTITSAVKYDENLTCAGLIKGNHKTPLSWNWAYSRRLRSGGFVIDRFRTYSVSNEGPDLGPPAISALSAVPPSAYNKALGKLYDNIRGNVDLSIDLAEIGKTTSMIRNCVKDVFALASSWRRGLTSGGKQIANSYLQYKYGVRPLIETAYELAQRQLLVAIAPVTYKSRAGYQNVSDRKSVNNNLHISTLETFKASRRCEISLTFSQSSPGISTLSQYTSLNPVSILWELTPYSFVADWFVDIGGYLRMAETALLNGLQFHSGYRSDSWYGFSTIKNSGSYYNGTSTYIHDTKGNLEEKGLTRSVLTAMPFPELPRVSVDLGSSRLLSAAALLSQFIKHP